MQKQIASISKASAASQRRERQGPEGQPSEGEIKNSHRVGAHADKHGITEADISAITAWNVPALGQRCENSEQGTKPRPGPRNGWIHEPESTWGPVWRPIGESI
jgi:hypothetical protein